MIEQSPILPGNRMHWIRFLPNVGEPFLARAAEIEALNAKIVKAVRRRDECERDVRASAVGNWTEDEVRQAHIDAAVWERDSAGQAAEGPV